MWRTKLDTGLHHNLSNGPAKKQAAQRQKYLEAAAPIEASDWLISENVEKR